MKPRVREVLVALREFFGILSVIAIICILANAFREKEPESDPVLASEPVIDEPARFICVGKCGYDRNGYRTYTYGDSFWIIVDKETGVQYIIGEDGGLTFGTVLMDTDGKPILYDLSQLEEGE